MDPNTQNDTKNASPADAPEALPPPPYEGQSSDQKTPGAGADADADQLPPYAGNAPPYPDNGRVASPPAATDMIPPDQLLLSGDSIYTASVQTSSNASHRLRLYELSHHIGHLLQSRTEVNLLRVDAQRTATAARRARAIYTLHRPPRITDPKFEFYLQSTSRGNTIHDVVLEPQHKSKMAFDYRPRRASRPRPGAELVAGEPLFSATLRNGGGYDWRVGSGEGRVLAFEVNDLEGMVLHIVEEMDRGLRDALVATWCLRIWHQTSFAEENKNKCKFSSWGGVEVEVNWLCRVEDLIC